MVTEVPTPVHEAIRIIVNGLLSLVVSVLLFGAVAFLLGLLGHLVVDAVVAGWEAWR